jgi:phosphatidylglycerol:prolipoprotein diacylglycerol transferase
MYPLLFDSIPVYYLTWVCAGIVCIPIGVRLAVNAGFPACRSSIAVVVLGLSILVGSKLLYVAEAQFFPFDDYVPEHARRSLHGFRIPGGILLLAVSVPIVCRALGLPWQRFGDRLVLVPALTIVFVRLGCFLNGCCFGKASSLPWAVTFPRGSWAFWYQWKQGWLSPSSEESLPVHPLQLYFVAAALLIFVVLVRAQSRVRTAGRLQRTFDVLFFGTTALLEPLRANSLTLNNWLAPTATIIAGGILLRQAVVSRRSLSEPAYRRMPTIRS